MALILGASSVTRSGCEAVVVARTHRALRWAARRPVLVRPEGLLQAPSGALGPVYNGRTQLPRAGPSSPRLWLSPATGQVWRSDVEDATPDGGATS